MSIRKSAASAAALLGLVCSVAGADAQTLNNALAAAYSNNPTLNAARAELRGVDEGVAQALSGWRPQVFGSLSAGHTSTYPRPGSSTHQNTATVGVQIDQPLFRGFRTVNGTRQAEAAVSAQRESLRSTEQTVMFDAAQAYMDVIRDTAIVSLRRSDIKFLDEQVRAARDRFQVGEGTRTDTAQADARLAAAQSSLNLALANLNASRAVFRQVIGVDANSLVPNTDIRRLVPRSMESAIASGTANHPAILAAQFNTDAAAFNVKSIEGELLPTVSLEGNLAHQWNPSSTGAINDASSASVFGRVSVPIYQGGAVSSRVRQAKEQLGNARILVDVARDQVRAAVVATWGQFQAAEASIVAARSQVEASQLALSGVVEEQRVGQRTTLDVLDSQRELITAQVTLVTAQRDSLVAAFALVSAIGRLTSEHLQLHVARYDPVEHAGKVRDKWFGLRTPDGR
ncbi:TolC family outer membrane protein [Breoghania sp. L-A4]|uniref:TolC family outer membrane protein n=1 Tax=Breoghania sp. L-A4 TaxID=2304600 RepID=UPI0020C14E40|nr:TolC family outer membrane protein [Breoghania sp. L-A4]